MDEIVGLVDAVVDAVASKSLSCGFKSTPAANLIKHSAILNYTSRVVVYAIYSQYASRFVNYDR